MGEEGGSTSRRGVRLEGVEGPKEWTEKMWVDVRGCNDRGGCRRMGRYKGMAGIDGGVDGGGGQDLLAGPLVNFTILKIHNIRYGKQQSESLTRTWMTLRDTQRTEHHKNTGLYCGTWYKLACL